MAAFLLVPAAHAQSTANTSLCQTAFLTCKACHSLEAGKTGKNGVGPGLHGIFGRKAGSEAGYNYSPAMKASNVIRSEDTLNKPGRSQGFIPGNKMPFPGLPDAQKRSDVIT